MVPPASQLHSNGGALISQTSRPSMEKRTRAAPSDGDSVARITVVPLRYESGVGETICSSGAAGVCPASTPASMSRRASRILFLAVRVGDQGTVGGRRRDVVFEACTVDGLRGA